MKSMNSKISSVAWFAISLLGLAMNLGAGLTTAAVAEPQAASTVLWRCDAWSDPDYITGKIVKIGDELFADVFQESGDGDEGGAELVPVRAIPDGATFRYEQIGPARLPEGGVGQTTDLVLKITISREEGPYLMTDGTLIATSGPTGAGADEINEVTCYNYDYNKVVKNVWLNQPLRDQDVDMTGKVMASIRVPYVGGWPTIEPQSGALCNSVKVWSVEQYGDDSVRVRVEPEFALDDGLNVCPILITQTDGSQTTVNLSYMAGEPDDR